MEIIIKRYQNRKLYSTHHSCYVTLEEIAQLICEGNNVVVYDNKTKREITYQTYLQVLFSQEKKVDKDTELLKKVICSNSATFTGYIEEIES
jgi:polyhydroxyalkanoate synthesis repressor PhaR